MCQGHASATHMEACCSERIIMMRRGTYVGVNGPRIKGCLMHQYEILRGGGGHKAGMRTEHVHPKSRKQTKSLIICACRRRHWAMCCDGSLHPLLLPVLCLWRQSGFAHGGFTICKPPPSPLRAQVFPQPPSVPSVPESRIMESQLATTSLQRRLCGGLMALGEQWFQKQWKQFESGMTNKNIPDTVRVNYFDTNLWWGLH